MQYLFSPQEWEHIMQIIGELPLEQQNIFKEFSRWKNEEFLEIIKTILINNPNAAETFKFLTNKERSCNISRYYDKQQYKESIEANNLLENL